MVCISLIGGWVTFSWTALALFLPATASVLLFGHSLGSHRKLIHDSFGCPKWLEYALVYAGVQVGLAGPLGLLAQHNLRDYAQRQPDCHDFLRHGTSFWHDGWWQLHCDLALDDPPALPIPESISQDPFYRFLERTWMLQQIPPALVLYALGGWSFVIWGGCARIAAGVTGHWLIGYFAHNHGDMHQVVDGAAVQGHNVKFASLLTMGESWHNNHHAWPGSARLGLYPGEWDPGWWLLVLLERAGWVWRLRLPADCAPRPELRSHDGRRPIVPTGPHTSTVATLRSIMTTSARLLARRGNAVLRGPCIALSEQWLRRLAGTPVSVVRTQEQARLVLHDGKDSVCGLPALLIAIGSRNVWTAAGAIVLLPLATMCEIVRGQFQA
jgi:stearoyl-CoA desaturase (delta-9 desaturase)